MRTYKLDINVKGLERVQDVVKQVHSAAKSAAQVVGEPTIIGGRLGQPRNPQDPNSTIQMTAAQRNRRAAQASATINRDRQDAINKLKNYQKNMGASSRLNPYNQAQTFTLGDGEPTIVGGKLGKPINPQDPSSTIQMTAVQRNRRAAQASASIAKDRQDAINRLKNYQKSMGATDSNNLFNQSQTTTQQFSANRVSSFNASQARVSKHQQNLQAQAAKDAAKAQRDAARAQAQVVAQQKAQWNGVRHRLQALGIGSYILQRGLSSVGGGVGRFASGALGLSKVSMGLAGAAAGSVFGPKGAAVGAVLGIVVGHIKDMFDMLVGPLTALKEATLNAASSMTKLHALQLMSGGTPFQAVGMSRLGFSAADAASLRERISSSGLAASTAMRLGISPGTSRLFGPANEAAMVDKVVKGMYGLTPTQRIVAARNLHIEDKLPAIERYYRNFRHAYPDMQLAGQVYDQETLHRGDDLSASLDRIRESFETLIAVLAKPFLQPFTAALNVMADWMQTLTKYLNDNPRVMQAVAEKLGVIFKTLLLGVEMWYNAVMEFNRAMLIALTPLQSLMVPGWMGTIQNATQPISFASAFIADFEKELSKMQNSQVTQDHSKAMGDHAKWLQEFIRHEGTFGGGPRTRNAVPPGFKGVYFDSYYGGGIVPLGTPIF